MALQPVLILTLGLFQALHAQAFGDSSFFQRLAEIARKAAESGKTLAESPRPSQTVPVPPEDPATVTGWANASQVSLRISQGEIKGWANASQVQLKIADGQITGWANSSQAQLKIADGQITGWANGSQVSLRLSPGMDALRLLDALILRLPAPVLRAAGA